MYRLRLRKKTRRAGGRCLAACLGRGHGAHCPRLFSAASQRQTTKFCWSPATDEYLGLVFFSGSSRPGTQSRTPEPTILRSAQQRLLLDPPCRGAALVVNSEPHNGARPSARLCVGRTDSYFSGADKATRSKIKKPLELNLETEQSALSSRSF
jgi:hypothetical protein